MSNVMSSAKRHSTNLQIHKRVARALAISLLVFVTSGASPAYCDAIDDSKALIGQLNPLSLALGPLIDRAAADVDTVLQKRLEQLNGIVQLSLYTLNQIAQQRIQDVDEKTRQQIIDLNHYVSTDLLQFNSIIGKNLDQVNTILGQNIDKFNFGVANTISSIKFLDTIPLINVGGTGISIYKQQGTYTEVMLAGSGLKRFDNVPTAYLVADGSTEQIKVDVAASSMGLLELHIPNEKIPGVAKAQSYVLNLRLQEDRVLWLFPSYSEQSFPLRICGTLPRYKMRFTVSASGKQLERKQIPHPAATPYADTNVIGVQCRSGNGNSLLDVCPTVPPSGWQIDDGPPYWGVSATRGETGNNTHSVGRTATGCIRIYCDGSTGDSHENIMGVVVLLKRLAPVEQCATPIVAAVDLTYSSLTQMALNDATTNAIGVCAAAAAAATPQVLVKAELIDASNNVIETKNLNPNVSTTALDGSLRINMDDHFLVDMNLSPACRWNYSAAVSK